MSGFNESDHRRARDGKFATMQLAEAGDLDLVSASAGDTYNERGYDWRGLGPAQAAVRDHADAIKAETDPDRIRLDYAEAVNHPNPDDRTHETLIAIAQNPNTPAEVLDEMAVVNLDTPRPVQEVARRMGGYVKGWSGCTVEQVRDSIRTLPSGETVQVMEESVGGLEGSQIDDKHNDETIYVSKVTNQRDGRVRLDLVVTERGKEAGPKRKFSRHHDPRDMVDDVIVRRGLPKNPPIIHAGRVVRDNEGASR